MPNDMPSLAMLATDLDGTFFPTGADETHQTALRELASVIDQHSLDLVFVTGRSFDHVIEGIAEHDPPRPSTIICDVGTTIMHRDGDGYERDEDYHEHLRELLGGLDAGRLSAAMTGLNLGIVPQRAENQTDLKHSFNYPAESRVAVEQAVEQWINDHNATVSMTISVDPFTGEGLLDLLPRGANKGHALNWWIERKRTPKLAVVFAGDTGNDTAAINAGVRAILVGNADDQLRSAARAHHDSAAGTLYEASGTATNGVLEGLRWHLGVE